MSVWLEGDGGVCLTDEVGLDRSESLGLAPCCLEQWWCRYEKPWR